MVTVLLVRHAMTAANGVRLSGRAPDVHLTRPGWSAARRLAEVLAALAPRAIYASPLERAIETAAPLSARLHQSVRIDDDLNEIDFGAWTGQSFAELDTDEAWRLFNSDPATAVIPQGEALDAVGRRGASAIARFASQYDEGPIVVVTHGDVIRLTIARLLQMPLGAFRSLVIEPGECCRVFVNRSGAVLGLDALGLSALDDTTRSRDWSADAYRRPHRTSLSRVS
jgi:probable phosphoglycerate mutase